MLKKKPQKTTWSDYNETNWCEQLQYGYGVIKIPLANIKSNVYIQLMQKSYSEINRILHIHSTALP